MPIVAFDHVNIRTNRLAEMTGWYERILGLKAGPRPDFGFPGAWLYLGDVALVHLVETPVQLDAGAATAQLEHFAFTASGMAGFLALLEREGIPVRLVRVAAPAGDVVQVNIHDPDGNHIHVDFPGAEADALGL
ncbi:MAG: glyoxalase [Alphaproteobacteria bacterium]|nr:MAG: glyoxalase [Alphaproteobacteria bacterium]